MNFQKSSWKIVLPFATILKSQIVFLLRFFPLEKFTRKNYLSRLVQSHRDYSQIKEENGKHRLVIVKSVLVPIYPRNFRVQSLVYFQKNRTHVKNIVAWEYRSDGWRHLDKDITVHNSQSASSIYSHGVKIEMFICSHKLDQFWKRRKKSPSLLENGYSEILEKLNPFFKAINSRVFSSDPVLIEL